MTDNDKARKVVEILGRHRRLDLAMAEIAEATSIDSRHVVARLLAREGFGTASGHLAKNPRAGLGGFTASGVATPLLSPQDGYHVKGTSTLVSPDGEVKAQWVKVNRDAQERFQALEQAIAGLIEPVRGYAAPVKAPKRADSDLMCVLPLGDPHVGLLSWAAETGEDYDLRIAESVLCGAVDQAVELAPAAGRCLLINLGDYFHADNQENRTMRSGHQLDVDSRWAKILEVGIRIQRHMVERCLEKFETVDVDNVRGNHDDHSSVMLAHVMRAYFERDPRVNVCMSPALHHFFEFGKCLIGTHHGHATKFQALPLVMASLNPEAWGRTTHRRVYCGHIHSDSVKEIGACTVETVNTLAARDAYAAGAGYISGRDLKLDVWHRGDGMVNRHIIGIEQIRRAA